MERQKKILVASSMKNLRAAATPFIPEIVFIINASKILEKSKYKKEVKNDLFFDKHPFLTKAAAGIP